MFWEAANAGQLLYYLNSIDLRKAIKKTTKKKTTKKTLAAGVWVLECRFGPVPFVVAHGLTKYMTI